MILTVGDLPRLRKRCRNQRIVFAGGTFDLFHNGHLESCKNLRQYGDIVVVAVSTDKRVRERKGAGRPILSQKSRVELIDSIRYVDYSLIMPNKTQRYPYPTMQVLELLRPDVFVTVDRKWLQYEDQITDLGITLKLVPRVNKNSTTRIINKIVRSHR